MQAIVRRPGTVLAPGAGSDQAVTCVEHAIRYPGNRPPCMD